MEKSDKVEHLKNISKIISLWFMSTSFFTLALLCEAYLEVTVSICNAGRLQVLSFSILIFFIKFTQQNAIYFRMI